MALNEAHAHEQTTMTGGVETITESYPQYDDKQSGFYQWQWNGLGAGPSATFTQYLDLTVTPISFHGSTGAYVTASRSLTAGLYDIYDQPLAGNPLPLSDNGSTTITPAGVTGGAATTPRIKLQATLQPRSYYVDYVEVKVKTNAVSYARANSGNAGTQASGNGDGGLQKVTPTTPSVSTP